LAETRIVIDERYCTGCGICVRFCTKKILELSAELNSRGYYTPIVLDRSKCKSCRTCELYCPDFAVFIVEDEEQSED